MTIRVFKCLWNLLDDSWKLFQGRTTLNTTLAEGGEKLGTSLYTQYLVSDINLVSLQSYTQTLGLLMHNITEG